MSSPICGTSQDHEQDLYTLLPQEVTKYPKTYIPNAHSRRPAGQVSIRSALSGRKSIAQQAVRHLYMKIAHAPVTLHNEGTPVTDLLVHFQAVAYRLQ